ILFGSDYALWEPKWLVEKFAAFELPEDLQTEYGVDLTMETRKKILGLNAARLYDINPEEQVAKTRGDTFSQQAEQLYA
ncbi:MAG TPA: amidohydrolase family protein, partial [Ktedonobacteraceae bacterium]|nr:amidohydrolase family protein [Ktedonobacteraceae bacterium]